MDGNTRNSLNRKSNALLLALPFKRQKLRSAIAMCAGLAMAWEVQALGLGDIDSRSYLGQPLEATIQLVSIDGDVDLENLIIRRVTAEEAAGMGVELLAIDNQFEFTLDADSGPPSFNVSSRYPIKEPYINLFVELRWPTGVVYREYPILLDPAPAGASTAPRPAAEEQPQPSERRTGSNTAPVMLTPLATDDGNYQVQSGDTLSGIAERWSEGTDRGIGETAQWLFDNNTHAFRNNDMDQLMAGAVLQLPDMSAYRVRSQSSAAVEPTTQTTTESAESGSIPQTQGVTPEVPEEGQATQDGMVSSDTRGMLTIGSDSRDDKTRELIDMLVRENESLKARMERIESSEYLNTLKQLVLLQRQQISDLRRELGVADDGQVEEVDALLSEIGIESEAMSTVQVADTIAPAANEEQAAPEDDLSEATAAETAGELASDSQGAIVDIEQAPVTVTVEPEEEVQQRTWLYWLMLAAGVVLAGVFALLYFFYRRLVPNDKREANRGEDLPEFSDDQKEPFMSGEDEGVGAARSAVRSRPRAAESASDPTLVAYDGEDATLVPARKERDETDWHGEKVHPEDYADTEFDDLQSEFGDLTLDEDALSSNDSPSEEPFEAITQEIPSEPIDESFMDTDEETELEFSKGEPEKRSATVTAIGAGANDPQGKREGKDDKTKDGKDKKRKDKESELLKPERRPDEEVRLSIAEKMAQYDPDEYQQELANLGILELDEIADLDEVDENEVDTVIYRAMMFCEFRKFDKARQLIENKMASVSDAKLLEAMDHIASLEEQATKEQRK